MNASPDHSLSRYLTGEHFIITRFLRGGVDPVIRLIFKLPILMYRLGLGDPISQRILAAYFPSLALRAADCPH